MIKVFFNGKELEVAENTSLNAFLTTQISLEGKFAIEINLEVISKSEYHNIILQNGMKIEAITFVGGG